MSVFTDFLARLNIALDALVDEGRLAADLDRSRLTVELPRDRSHGDLATNAALVLGKAASRNPRELAQDIADKLENDDDVDAVSIAGPGFINLTLAKPFWRQILLDVLEKGGDFGRPGLGNNAPVNVEYVSANPTGPMHVGHCRGAVVGDAIANVLEYAGYDVTREYYINDAGAQVDVLARSAYHRYREALGHDVGPVGEGLYPGDYLISVGESLKQTHGDGLVQMDEADWLPICREAAIDGMMVMIRGDLAALSIKHDVFFSERTLIEGKTDRVQEVIQILKDRDLIYQGRLDPPKGQLPDDWEDREQTLFRSTRFGDDSDRALLKSDGSYTYFANDIAYHYDKFARGFAQMIDIWGADHGGYVKRLKSAVTGVTDGAGSLEIELCQLVKLYRDGEPVRMSKRSGDFVTLRDVVDEVGSDPVRFMMLYRKADAPLDFDFKKVTEQSKDNPVFYVQYAFARAHSVLRQVREQFGAEADEIIRESRSASLKSLDLIETDAEINLIKSIAELPSIMAQAANHREPHRIAFYLYQLAASFHGLWNLGKDLPQLRFINPDRRDLTIARLSLVQGVIVVIEVGLDVLGVQSPEIM